MKDMIIRQGVDNNNNNILYIYVDQVRMNL